MQSDAGLLHSCTNSAARVVHARLQVHLRSLQHRSEMLGQWRDLRGALTISRNEVWRHKLL